MHYRFRLLSAALLILLPVAARAQAGISTRLVFPLETGRTGVFRIPVGESQLQVQAEIRTSDGTPIRPERCPVTWRTANPSILKLDRTAEGSAWVSSVAEGITQLNATFACAADAAQTVSVVVGSAAIDKPFSAADSLDNFYPKSLNVTVPGWARVSGGKVYFRPIDEGIQFVASAYNGDDALITAYEFPMRWSVSNPAVLKLDTAYDHTAHYKPVGIGTTRVTFAVEGLTRSFDVTVQNEYPATNDDHTTLVLTSSATAPAAVVQGATIQSSTPITTATTTRTAAPTTTSTAATSTTTTPATTTTPIARTSPATTTVDPAAVHATGFTAVAGYGNIQLKWNAAPGAVGYRIAREGYDPAQQKWITTGTARIPSAIGPDEVSTPADLLAETTYLDANLSPSTQYVYVLSTYYKSSKGVYYYADRASEPRATATPRNASSMSWLPADWQEAPKLTNVKILSETHPGGKSTVTYLIEWQPKGGAAGYIVSLMEASNTFDRETKLCGSRPEPIQVAPTRPGAWYITVGNRLERTSEINYPTILAQYQIFDAHPGVCVQVRAVYPNKVNSAGTPDVINAFYTEISGPGPEWRFQVLPDAVISRDAAAMFWAAGLNDKWEIVPPDVIQRW